MNFYRIVPCRCGAPADQDSNESESDGPTLQQQEKMCEEAKVESNHNDKSIADLGEMHADLEAKFIEASNFARELKTEYSTDRKIVAKFKTETEDHAGVAGGKDPIADKDEEAFMLLEQIQQRYLLLCKRSGIEPEYEPYQIEDQMAFIKRENEVLEEIIQMTDEMIELEDQPDNEPKHGSIKKEKPRK